jgi:polar amino acid transport system substrate-binding protein
LVIDCGKTPIRLAFYEYGLFYFTGDGGVAKGIDSDIVDELKKRSGCKFETQVMARARIWADLSSGALDMSVSGIQNMERDRFAWFAQYAVVKNFALVQADNAKTVRNADEFLAATGLKFGVVRSFKHGTAQDQWLDTLRAQQRVEESPDADTVFRKLKDRRVQAIFSQPIVYRRMLDLFDMRNQVVIEDWTPTEMGVLHGLILAKSRFSETHAGQWRELVNGMHQDGTLKKIYSRYLPPAEVTRMLDY